MSVITQAPPTLLICLEKFRSARPVYSEQELCSHAHSQIKFYIGTARLYGEAELRHPYIFKIKNFFGAARLPYSPSHIIVAQSK